VNNAPTVANPLDSEGIPRVMGSMRGSQGVMGVRVKREWGECGIVARNAPAAPATVCGKPASAATGVIREGGASV